MRLIISTVAAAVVALGVASTSQAALLIELSSNNGSSWTADAAPFSLEQGQTATLWLRARVSPSESSGSFLNSYGLQLNFSNAFPVSQTFQVLEQNLFTSANTANSIRGSLSTGRPDINAAPFIFAKLRFTASGFGPATLTFSDASLGDGGVTFSTTAAADSPSNSATGRDIDTFGASVGAAPNFIRASAAFSVTAIPEPSSMMLLAGAIGGAGFFARRRQAKSSKLAA